MSPEDTAETVVLEHVEGSAVAVAEPPPTTPEQLPPLTQAVSSFNKAKQETNDEVVESADFVDALYRAFAARTHVYVHGVGGVGKTYGTEITARHFEVPSFYVQLRPDSKREELFGPLSMRQLQHDVYEHVTGGYMPEAVFVNLDELRDAGRFLRQMLSILNERWFVNGNTRLDVPLRTAVGTTNEPIDDTETHLEALLDRFPQRLEQKPIGTSRGFKKILVDGLARDIDIANGVDRSANYHKVSPAEVAVITNAVLTCKVDKDIIAHVDDLRKEVKKELKAPRSPRRWLEGLRNVKAEAVLNGRDHVTPVDLRVLKLMLPNHPDEYKISNDLCANFRDKTTAAVEEANKALEEIRKQLAPAKEALAKSDPVDLSALPAVSKMTRELSGKLDEYKSAGADATKIDEIAAAIRTEEQFMQKAVLGH